MALIVSLPGGRASAGTSSAKASAFYDYVPLIYSGVLGTCGGITDIQREICPFPCIPLRHN